MLSRDIRHAADQLAAQREYAIPLPWGGTFWAALSLSEVDALINVMRDWARTAAALEALPVPEEARQPALPANVVRLARPVVRSGA